MRGLGRVKFVSFFAALGEGTIEIRTGLLRTLTGREIYRMLVRDRVWTPQAYEEWRGDMLIVTLLKSESVKPKKSRYRVS